MVSNKDFYNVVVIGAMNPRLHTPGWYRLVGLIDDVEMKEANEARRPACEPHGCAMADKQFQNAMSTGKMGNTHDERRLFGAVTQYDGAGV